MNTPPELKAQLEFMADKLIEGDFDNVLLLFKQVPTFFNLLPFLIEDERFRVRTGTHLLLEELAALAVPQLHQAAEFISPLLKHENDQVRGDAVSAMEIVGSSRDVPLLRQLLEDKNPQVAQLAEEAIEEIEYRSQDRPIPR